MPDTKQAYERAMTLAALSGLKIALGPAFLRTAKGAPSARNWVIAALGEMVLDKVGVFPARYSPSLLIPHTAVGAWVARESLKEDGIDDSKAVAIAAGVAAGAAIAAPLIRLVGNRLLGIPDALLGLAEDALAIHLGSRATGLSLHQVGDAAKEAVEAAKGAVEEAGERVKPALHSVGIGA